MISYKEALLVIFALSVLVGGVGFVGNAAAKRHFCENNLRKLYSYAEQYQADHGALPPVNIPMKPLWKFWFHLLKPYSASQLDFACPEDQRAAYLFETRQSPLFSPKNQDALSYGMNYFLTAHFADKKKVAPFLKNLSAPGKVVFLGDSKGPYMLPDRFWTYEKAFRHEEDQANFLYADGHIAYQKQTDFGRFEGERFITDFTKWHWN